MPSLPHIPFKSLFDNSLSLTAMFTLSTFILTLFNILFFFQLAEARPLRKRCTAAQRSSSSNPKPTSTHSPAANPAATPQLGGCFPSAGFNTPSISSGSAPSVSLDNWWCPRNSEYAFMGFSYAVDPCQSKATMLSDFKEMHNTYHARYIRVYAACDGRSTFYDDLIEAAYEANMGVFALVWFGFNNDGSYKGRWSNLLNTIKTNPLAPYVIHNVAMGSEPLFDGMIPVDGLVSLVNQGKADLHKYGIEVSVSEMVHGYQIRAGSDAVLAAVDHVQSNTLPFFSDAATTGSAAWPSVNGDIKFYEGKTNSNKKIHLTENGWPSNQDVWKANVASAVASISSEQGYYKMLDSQCPTLKKGPQGGIGWFAHTWDDNGLPGWGVTIGGKPKFPFSARTSC